MIITSPLWLLLLGLVPLIVILHAIAVRWRRAPVSSLVFWREALRERRASLRVRRLLANLSLILEVLAVIALSLALAGPRAAARGLSGSGDVILVLDATASMQAREAGGTRFDLARGRALELVAGLRRGARMAVVLAERAPRLAAAFTDDHVALRRALESASATDEPGDVGDSMLFALRLRDARRGDQVALLTDGAFESLGGVDTTLPWIHLITVGTRRHNVGITGLAFRRAATGEAAYEMFLSVRDVGGAEAPGSDVTVPLSVTVDRAPVVARAVTCAAGGRASFSIPWTGPTEGRVEARLRARDDFPLDDAAFAVFTPARGVRVLVEGSGTYFIRSALESLPGVTVRAETGAVGGPGLVDESEGYDVAVYAGVQPPALVRGSYLLFSAVPPNLPIHATGSLRLPPVTGWDRSSPLLASVPLGGVTIGQSLALEPGPGFNVLASSGGSPLILSWDHAGLKALLVAFDPQGSDFPLTPGFPIFMARALSWFFPAWLSVQADQVQAGDGRILSAEGESSLMVTRPDNSRVEVAAEGSTVEWYDTARTGFYRVETGTAGARPLAREFAVSLTSDSETDIMPRYIAAETGDEQSDAGAEGAGAPSPIWSLFAVIALVLMAAEWLVWMRSGAGAAGTRPQDGRP
jgi:hypothetical protein